MYISISQTIKYTNNYYDYQIFSMNKFVELTLLYR
jgi:hypothetical protein